MSCTISTTILHNFSSHVFCSLIPSLSASWLNSGKSFFSFFPSFYLKLCNFSRLSVWSHLKDNIYRVILFLLSNYLPFYPTFQPNFSNNITHAHIRHVHFITVSEMREALHLKLLPEFHPLYNGIDSKKTISEVFSF